jgi:hypothetical protein
MRFKNIRQKRHRKRQMRKNKEAALVTGGKHIRDKAASQIIAGGTVRIGGDAVDLSNIRTPSPAMSMFGGSDNGGSSGKRSRDERILTEMMESERKKIELDSEARVKDNELRMEIHQAEMTMQKQELDLKFQEVETFCQQNQIMLTTLQNEMAQHQQAMELQMKQFELQLKQYNEKM